MSILIVNIKILVYGSLKTISLYSSHRGYALEILVLIHTFF